MNKSLAILAALLTTGVFAAAASAAPAKAPAAKAGKMVTLYQADRCHMYFSAAQAKQDKYTCPDSKGKMKKVTVTAAAAKADLAPKKAL